jgi:drug/metabolite transporter (DMT)-like permease
MGRREQTIGIVFVILSTLGFATLVTLTRLAFEAGVDVPTGLAVRFGLAALLAWPVLIARGRWRLPPGRLPGLMLLSVVFVANTATFFLAVRYVSAAMVAVIFYTYPVLVTVLSLLFLGERVTPIRSLALALATAGGLLTLGTSLTTLDVDLRGVVFAAVSALFYSVYIVLSSRITRDIPVGISSTWVMTGAAAAYLAYGLGTRSLNVGFAPRGWLLMAVIVVVATVLPVQFFLAGVLKIGPSLASIIGTVEPVFSVALAGVVLGDQVTVYQTLGGALVLFAIVLLRLPLADRAARADPSVQERPSSV